MSLQDMLFGEILGQTQMQHALPAVNDLTE